MMSSYHWHIQYLVHASMLSYGLPGFHHKNLQFETPAGWFMKWKINGKSMNILFTLIGWWFLGVSHFRRPSPGKQHLLKSWLPRFLFGIQVPYHQKDLLYATQGLLHVESLFSAIIPRCCIASLFYCLCYSILPSPNFSGMELPRR